MSREKTDERGVPQGSFFDEHPIMSIFFAVIGGLSLTLMAAWYEQMEEEQQALVRQSLDEIDEILKLLEEEKTKVVPPDIIELEKIRKQRQQVRELKELIAA